MAICCDRSKPQYLGSDQFVFLCGGAAKDVDWVETSLPQQFHWCTDRRRNAFFSCPELITQTCWEHINRVLRSREGSSVCTVPIGKAGFGIEVCECSNIRCSDVTIRGPCRGSESFSDRAHQSRQRRASASLSSSMPSFSDGLLRSWWRV